MKNIVTTKSSGQGKYPLAFLAGLGGSDGRRILLKLLTDQSNQAHLAGRGHSLLCVNFFYIYYGVRRRLALLKGTFAAPGLAV